MIKIIECKGCGESFEGNYQRKWCDMCSMPITQEYKNKIKAYQKERQAGWYPIRNRIIKRDSGKCVFCESAEKIEVHHLIPYRESRKHQEDELVTLCDLCHKVFSSHALWTSVYCGFNEYVDTDDGDGEYKVNINQYKQDGFLKRRKRIVSAIKSGFLKHVTGTHYWMENNPCGENRHRVTIILRKYKTFKPKFRDTKDADRFSTVTPLPPVVAVTPKNENGSASKSEN